MATKKSSSKSSTRKPARRKGTGTPGDPYGGAAAKEKTARNKARFLKAYEASLGNITAASNAIGIARTTYYLWRDTDPEFVKACEDAIELQKDFVESQLMKLIRDGDSGSVRFYLQTKGRDRGYGDKMELTGAGGKDLIPSISIEVIDTKAQVTEGDTDGESN